MSKNFLVGFTTARQHHLQELKITKGTVPPWLTGTLVRNGPALYDVRHYKFRHWFDGMAMLHAFHFKPGQVTYTNRFLQTRAFRYAQKHGEVRYREAATEPHTSLFNTISFILDPVSTDNANVNVIAMNNLHLALTETPHMVMFDPRNMKTLGEFEFSDSIKGILTTAHPHYDFARKTLYNYVTDFGFSKAKYNVYSLPNGQTQRRLLASVSVDKPAYMHTFSLTPNYIILSEYPFRLGSLLDVVFKDRPVFKDYEWTDKAHGGHTRFLVISRQTGKVVRVRYSEPFFGMHHVNAFEVGNDIFLDVCAYDDVNLINKFYFNSLLKPDGGDFPQASLRRYRLAHKSSTAEYELLSNEQIDLPRFDYQKLVGQKYTYVYGQSVRADRPNDFANQLVKIDVVQRTAQCWFEEGCYPGEPVFIPNPEAVDEDDGILLSVVLDSNHACSFLLILNAKDIADQSREIARVQIPDIIPHGIHGAYFDGTSF